MPRSSHGQVAERLAYTAQAMTRLRATHLVLKEVADHFGVAERTVMTWMRRVREQRRVEATELDRDAARDQLRADYNAVVSMAMNRTEIVKDKDGNPIIDPNTGRPTVRSKPDLGHAIQALRELSNLDGLPEPVRHEHKIEAKVDSAPDLHDLSPDALKAGLAFIATLTPDGDVTKVLGDAFKLAGSRPAMPADIEAASKE